MIEQSNPMKKNKYTNIHRKQILTGSAIVLAAIASVFADGTPAATTTTPAVIPAAKPPAATGTLNSFFNGALPDAIGNSKISVNARLRWEYADQSNLKAANAETLRTRFGLTTAPLYGFQAMIEAENVLSLGEKNDYNAAGSNPGGAGKTIIADPTTTELNQAWLSYTYTNLPTTIKGGRERIVLDNARFIGDVAWRQNQQTFDAASVQSSPIKDLTVFYSYVWDVHRVFGDVSGLPVTSPNHDFKSDSHLINVSYDCLLYTSPSPRD